MTILFSLLITLDAAALEQSFYTMQTTLISDPVLSGTETSLEPPPPDAPAEVLPNPPLVYVSQKTTRYISLEFLDKSDVEEGFTVYRKQSGGKWEELGSFGAISNRTAPLFIKDDGEVGFRILDSANGKEFEELPVALSGGSLPYSYSATNYTKEIDQDTEYCYLLVPFNELGESDRVQPICTRTTRDLHYTGGYGTFALVQHYTSAYDLAVLVDDRAGLVGELNEEWSGTKLVYVADDAVIDLSAYDELPLKAGLTLMSGRDKLNEGALLATHYFSDHLFIVKGNNVQVKGLRFRGPSGSSEADQLTTKGIYFNIGSIVKTLSKDTPLSLLIEGNEFYQWTHAAVFIENRVRAFDDGLKIIDKDTADRIRITNNYFHHNQRQDTGYGIEIAGYTYVYIDRNTFDYNRHAIASTGGRGYIIEGYGPEHGYKAYLNLTLPGHTDQCYAGVCVTDTHNFDVHGTEDNWLSIDYYDGWAGEYFDVADNSFLSIEGDAFNVRGTPSDAAYFSGNVLPPALIDLKYSYRSKDVWHWVNEESDRDNIYVSGNHLYDDARASISVGDFDGDGIDDVFLATGAAWYYSSGARSEWRFLNKSAFRLEDLVLTDYDSDGKADVLRKSRGSWLVSRGGVGGWTTVDRYDIDVSSVEPDTGTNVTGDFTGDGNIDQLRFDWNGDRYFYVNGVRHSRNRM
jgi:hypothetical protein